MKKYWEYAVKINHKKLEYLLPVILIAFSTVIFLPGRIYFPKEQWALLYLLVIVFAGSISGIKASIISAILAFFTWNYFFIPPFHTFLINDPKDLLQLFVFLIVATIIGLQTGKLSEKENQARTREQEALLLNRISKHLITDLTLSKMIQILQYELVSQMNTGDISLLICDDSEKLIIVPEEISNNQKNDINSEIYKKACLVFNGIENIEITEINKGEIYFPLITSSMKLGVLYIGKKNSTQNYTYSEIRLLSAVAHQVSSFIERKHLETMAIQADALKEADSLKSTFISSISHELKTPLASIMATVTNLLDDERESDIPLGILRVELEAVKKDIDRLNISISSLIDFSRLESASWKLKKDWYEVGEILATILHNFPEKLKNRIDIKLLNDLPQVKVDFMQISKVFQNILENALVYSGEETLVKIKGFSKESEIIINIEDEGPGISKSELPKIFNKFYRGMSSDRYPSGTGLGLTIASEIIKSHNGKIWAENLVPGGTRFNVSLPLGDVL